MPNLTLSIPEDLKKQMDKTKFINWSEVAREAIKKKAQQVISDEERETIDWSVKLQRAGRSGRLEELKKKGLI